MGLRHGLGQHGCIGTRRGVGALHQGRRMKERGPERRKSAGRRAGETGELPLERPPLVTCPHCATMVIGALLGIAFTNLAGGTLSQLLITGDRETAFVLAGIAIPVVAQTLMLAGPLFLYLFRERFREPLDGLSFGAASALGFTMASALAQFWPLLTGPLVGSGSPVDWAIRLARAGVLVMLINACTTGLVAVALLLRRHDRRR